MGNYTELKFKAKLRDDTPDSVLNLLNRVINEGDLGHYKLLFDSKDVFDPDIDHPFFKCDRWYMLLLSTNWSDNLEGGDFYKENGKWILSLHTEFKNYDDEIKHFFEWINPFIVGRKKKQYIGYYRGETQDHQTNLYIER